VNQSVSQSVSQSVRLSFEPRFWTHGHMFASKDLNVFVYQVCNLFLVIFVIIIIIIISF
jgi:hypothetical protein